jgi:Xaa-Pro aminopeptidase
MLKEIGRRKVESLQKLMSESGIDTLLLTEPVSYSHLVFTKVAQFVVVRQTGDPFVVIHPYSEDYVRTTCFSENLVGAYPWDIYAESTPYQTPSKAMIELLGGSQVVGMDFARAPHARIVELEKSFPDIEMVDCAPLLTSVLEIKDENEIDIIRHALDIAEEGMKIAAETVAPGVRELTVALEAEYRMRSLGAAGFEFPSNANSGVRGCWIGLPASEKTIEPGDAVGMDFGPIHSFYNADICRTVPCGTMNDTLTRMFDIVEQALKIAISSIRPGVTAHEVDDRVRSFYARQGWDGKFIHHTGHPVGNTWGPWLIKGNMQPLKEGMALALEPGLYEKELGGVRTEVDVVVRESGAEVLGSLPLRLW